MWTQYMRSGDESPPAQVAWLASTQRTRDQLLWDFHGPGAMLSSADPDTPIDPELAAEIEPFLSMHDATCYRVASQGEVARAQSAYAQRSVSALVLQPIERASAWEVLLRSIRQRTGESTDGSALVSLVMCQPDSLVLRDLKKTHAYVDLRSGAAWDLHLIGYTAMNGFWIKRPGSPGMSLWRFSAGRFLNIAARIQQGHAAGLVASNSAVTGAAPWRYSGTADLVSFMAYRDIPGLIDWPSLRAIQLLDAQGAYLDRSIGQIVEIMSDWREDGPEIREFAPGEMRQTAVSVLDLQRALMAVAGMVTSGVIGGAAYDLLKQLIGAH